jgi:hypothetical protein
MVLGLLYQVIVNDNYDDRLSIIWIVVFDNVMLYNSVMGTNIMKQPVVSNMYSADAGSRYLPNIAIRVPDYRVSYES